MMNPDMSHAEKRDLAQSQADIVRTARSPGMHGAGRAGRNVSRRALACCALLLAWLPSCANTDPFFVYKAHDGRVLVSHEELDAELAVSRYGLETLNWEEFAAEPRYLYLWSADAVDRALSAQSAPMEAGFCEFTIETGRVGAGAKARRGSGAVAAPVAAPLVGPVAGATTAVQPAVAAKPGNAFLGIGLSVEPGAVPGVLIESAVEGGPAHIAGLRGGDLIVSWEGAALATGAELLLRVKEHAPGDHVRLGVKRGDSSMVFSVMLGARPTGDEPATGVPEFDDILTNGNLAQLRVMADTMESFLETMPLEQREEASKLLSRIRQRIAQLEGG